VRSAPPRRYLDNAATSWPKPEPVLAAWERAARELGAVAGRGAYRSALEAGAIRDRARAAAARLLGGVDPARVALPAGCTLALNMAIHGLVRPGDHVIATAADHNAVLRPGSRRSRSCPATARAGSIRPRSPPPGGRRPGSSPARTPRT
jgi:selenocysteine lyase/cysteine desulfurase